MKTVLLFDVDGTLVTNSGTAHTRATNEAIKEIFGFEAVLSTEGNAHFVNGRQIDGLTIAAIIRNTLGDFGLSEDEITRSLLNIEEVSTIKYRKLLNSGAHAGDLIPGVIETLDALRQAGATMGLLTGGTRALVDEKLSAVGISGYFNWGGYGGTSYDRFELFGLAIDDLRSTPASVPDDLQLVYVGDTLFDVEAGHRAGATVVGVASGSCSAAALAEAGADHVFENLGTAREALLEIIKA